MARPAGIARRNLDVGESPQVVLRERRAVEAPVEASKTAQEGLFAMEYVSVPTGLLTEG